MMQLGTVRRGRATTVPCSAGQVVLLTVEAAGGTARVRVYGAAEAPVRDVLVAGRALLTLPPAANDGQWNVTIADGGDWYPPFVTLWDEQTPSTNMEPAVQISSTVTGTPSGPTWSVGYPDGGVFGPSSEVERVVRGAPADPDSAAKIEYMLAKNLRPYYGGIAATNMNDYTTPVYLVDPSTPGVTVGFRDEQYKQYVPGQLFDGGHFVNVPVPVGAEPAPGTDGQLTIVKPMPDGSHNITELWRAQFNGDGTHNVRTGVRIKGLTGADADAGVRSLRTYDVFTGWSAVWGGTTNTFQYPGGWYPDGTGSSASGLVTSAYSISVAEALSGVIKHAVSMCLVFPAIWNKFSWPAQRSDGSDTNPLAIMEGQRLVMDPTVDFATYPGLHPFARMVGVAAQQYGFIITDKAGAVSVNCEGDGAYVKRYGINRWDQIRQGTPNYLLMRNFPWERLYALPVNYGLAA